MAVSIRLTSFEMGNKIKSMMDDKKSNQEIIAETQIGRSQLTNYKRVIALGKLDELNQDKPLNDIVKENQGIKIKKEVKTKQEKIEEDINRNLDKKLQKEKDKIALDKIMIERIEYLESRGKEVNRYEYFSCGRWKTYVPIDTGLREDINERVTAVLRLQNMILRDDIQRNLDKYENSHKRRLKIIKNECDITKRRNNELNAQLNSLILSEGKTLDESLLEAHREIVGLKNEIENFKADVKKAKSDRMDEIHREYSDELDQKDLEIKALKELLKTCEERRRNAVHKNSKKYLASMAGYWESVSRMYRRESEEKDIEIKALKEKLRQTSKKSVSRTLCKLINFLTPIVRKLTLFALPRTKFCYWSPISMSGSNLRALKSKTPEIALAIGMLSNSSLSVSRAFADKIILQPIPANPENRNAAK